MEICGLMVSHREKHGRQRDVWAQSETPSSALLAREHLFSENDTSAVRDLWAASLSQGPSMYTFSVYQSLQEATVG